jgi:tetratricopeptide (TPR) repeat protein
MAQAGGGGDGQIVEQAKFALPPFEQIPERLQRRYGREVIAAMSALGLELSKIKYTSDGLKIVGFVYKPAHTSGQKLPAVIFNRGGLEDGVIGAQNFNYFYEMYRLASAGFVVLASQYRGADGSEGKDEAAVRKYRGLRRTGPDRYDFAEAELNNFGYELLFTNRVKEAIEIFKLNVEAYPQAFNTYDSLGEAYLADGQRDLAIKNYKRSLELNPRNTNAVEVLKRIGAQ